MEVKAPLRSKKWTAFMWSHSTLVGFLFYLGRHGGETISICLLVLVIGAIDILYLGGVYALDKYRMGVSNAISAAKGLGPKKRSARESTKPPGEPP